MRLKQLRLYGFKSFPHKTVLELSQGMTALVGPNGCGKSNVLDAIRWVLGEQKLSQLRCAKSEDLVFAGSARLSELGYADVSLVIENTGDFPDLPAEVELRRRYYRTGESGFWINREECRLKDIEAILRGGAAGGRLYSVFDAAKLASIVSGDLHSLLESAAGVLGYREKRKESERKLDLVRRDLIRLDDIIGERKRIVRGLSRQRRRAELYKELREKIVTLEARKMQARFEVIRAGIGEKSKILSGHEESERKLLLSAEQIRREIEGQDTELSKLLQTEREARATLDEVSSRLSQAAAQLSASRTRKGTLEENLVRINAERKQAEQRTEEIVSGIEQTRRMHEEAVMRRRKAEGDLAESRGRLHADEEALAAHRLRVIDARKQLKEVSEELAGNIEQRTREHSRAENAASLAEVANTELSRLSERASSSRSELAMLKQNLSTTSSALSGGERQVSETENLLARLNEDIRLAESERREAMENQSMISGQITSLKDRIENQPRRALRKRLGDRFRGLMEEFLSYPAELEAALEAVLYDILGFASAAGMPELSDLSLEGQAGLVLDRGRTAPLLERPSDPRFKLWLADKVTLKHRAPSLLSARLENWVLVEPDNLDALSQKYPGFSFVTTDGTALRSDGVVLLGRPRGVLADRRKLNELETRAKQIEASIASSEKSLRGSRKRSDGLGQKLDEARRSYLEERSRKQTLEIEILRAEERLAEVERERDRLRAEVRKRTDEAAETSRKAAELTEEINRLQSQRSDAEKALNAFEEKLAEEEEALRDKLAGLNDQLLALGKEEEAEHLAVERGERLGAERERLDKLLASLQKGEEDINKEVSELAEAIGKLQAQHAALQEHRDRQADCLSGIDTSGVMRTKREKEAQRAKLEAELDTLRETLIQLRTDLVLLKREEAELEPVVSAVPIDEVEAEQEEMSFEEVEAELADLGRRLQDLGPINEYAAVQYEEEKAELDKITEQHADATQAVGSLSSIIREIDDEARSRFETSFKAVKVEFRRTFNFFFPGGEADLRLENLEDPFNSPIIITARPEGKQLKRLAQLSDGERAMLGISLLFAFYAVRPAPFLFVDELDAPLDDNNVLKFASYLSHIKDRIQVFVITHNKRTMEKADTIYGVTMEEPGVSKIISVKLKDVKRHHVAVEEA
jgi:chromosome segregation protein